MCGIAGVLGGGRAEAETAVRRMLRAQAHRGPDDEGLELFDTPAGALALGHRRLSILDLSPLGHQPMFHPGTGDAIVFNGEIYNFPELRAELEAAGETLRSRSDTEVILHGFARWGEAVFERLQGMFALGLWCARERRLLLARDALGIKPLYLARGKDGGVLFASELRALRASRRVDGEPDRRALAGFLAYGAVQAPLTMLRDVRLLEPGRIAAVDAGGGALAFPPTTRRFWDFPHLRTPAPSVGQMREEMHGRLAESVRSHLLSDVPVGIFLSSGIDSTAVAALAREARGGDIDTFTVSIEGTGRNDEGPVATETARLLGVRHHDVTVSEEQVLGLARRWLASVDQPSVDGLNTYIISQAVRERGIVVALSGLGGDEVFGGYSSFRDVPKLARLLAGVQAVPAPVRGAVARLGLAGRGDSQRRKGTDLAARTRPTLRGVYFRRRRLLADEEMAALGVDAPALGLDEDFLPPEAEPDRGLLDEYPLSAVRLLETRFYMGNMLLRDADAMGMAHGLEIRVPLLDRRVIDYAFAVPGLVYMDRHGPNKPLLVAAAGGIPEHVRRLSKRGFSLPQARWLGGPLRALFEHSIGLARDCGLLDPQGVAGVWRHFLSDRAGPSWSRPWALGVLGQWLAAPLPDAGSAAPPQVRGPGAQRTDAA